MFKYTNCLQLSMKAKIRSIIDREQYQVVRKLVNYPSSASFNDSLIELTRQFKNLKNEVSEK